MYYWLYYHMTNVWPQPQPSRWEANVSFNGSWQNQTWKAAWLQSRSVYLLEAVQGSMYRPPGTQLAQAQAQLTVRFDLELDLDCLDLLNFN